jgi:CheY-like chemotaxis protein
MGAGAVLYAEDDHLDVRLMRRAWQKAGVPNPLHVVSDGEEARAYLSGAGHYANRLAHPMPSLLLVDLKLPRVNGLELLQWIREQPAIRAMRLIILSSSNLSGDVERAKTLGVNAYWAKPWNPRELEQLVMSLKLLWL